MKSAEAERENNSAKADESPLKIEYIFGDLFKRIARIFIERMPAFFVPDFNTVRNPDKNSIFFDIGIFLQILRDDKTPLLVGNRIDRAGKKHPVKRSRLLPGE